MSTEREVPPKKDRPGAETVEIPRQPGKVHRKRSLTRRLVRFVLWTVLVLVVLCVGFYFWASASYSDTALTMVNRGGDGTPPTTLVPGELTVLTFNMGYARGPAGDASGPWSEEHIRLQLGGIAAQIDQARADLVFLQEVDLGAARSHDIDEGKYLLDAVPGMRGMSCVVTWNKNYVPFPYWPPSKHYGHMFSGQCVLSRLPITSQMRHELPQPESNPFWRNAFYLTRAIDHVTLEIGGQAWDLFNVHTEAFDVPNRVEHAKILAGLVAAEKNPARIIVAGDFNAPPPEATQKKGFVDEPETDFTGDTTIEVARGMGLSEVLPDPGTFTFPADAPTRRLDYIWYGTALEKIEARVLGGTPGPWSDHLPVVARFRIK